MYDCSKHIISQDASLIEAIERINGLSGQSMVLFAVDDKQRMTGTLTDGDVRRFLIAKRSLDVTVREIMHRNFRCFEQGKISVEKVREVRRQGITLVPCLDSECRIVEVYDFTSCHSILPLDAIMMAGGRGEAATADTDHPEAAAQNRRQVHHRLQRGGSCQERGEKHCRHDQLPRRAAR